MSGNFDLDTESHFENILLWHSFPQRTKTKLLFVLYENLIKFKALYYVTLEYNYVQPYSLFQAKRGCAFHYVETRTTYWLHLWIALEFFN